MSTSATFHLPPLPDSRASADTASRATSDVRLFHTADGGEIEMVGGLITLADGLESAVYLSLFGGNERDSSLSSDDRRQWWGNLLESEEARVYRSQTQHLLRALPATTANLRRIEDAVARDLGWMAENLTSSITAGVTMPRRNTVQIDVSLEMKSGAATSRYTFTTDWPGRA